MLLRRPFAKNLFRHRKFAQRFALPHRRRHWSRVTSADESEQGFEAGPDLSNRSDQVSQFGETP
jgi:hypothetical protein